MEFNIVYGKFVDNKIDKPISKVFLDSKEILTSNVFDESYVFYRIRVDDIDVYCSVTTEPINGKFSIFFLMYEYLIDQALDEFKEYLKENHKKNIVELMI